MITTEFSSNCTR